jgi:predicted nucleic acid-binding protein
MIIVDTSVWVDHFKHRDPSLIELMTASNVGLHPYVLGELTLGGLPTHGAVFDRLVSLAQPGVASPVEIVAFISWAKLAGTGVGYVDAHLLVSARMTANARVLTKDKRLNAEAKRLGLAFGQ